MGYGKFAIPFVVAFALIAIGSFAEHPDRVGLGEDAKKALEEIGKAGEYALAILIGSAAIKEVIEAALKESGKDLKQTISTTFGDTGRKVESGFGGLTTVVQAALLQMKVNVQLIRDEPSLKESDDAVAKMVPATALTLAREGKASEAIAKIETDSADPKAKAEQEIAVLLLSSKEQDWENAAERLERGEAPSTDAFHRLSFKFWTAGKVDRAIQLAEEGLALAQRNPNRETVSLELKNNLAYF